MRARSAVDRPGGRERPAIHRGRVPIRIFMRPLPGMGLSSTGILPRLVAPTAPNRVCSSPRRPEGRPHSPNRTARLDAGRPTTTSRGPSVSHARSGAGDRASVTTQGGRASPKRRSKAVGAVLAGADDGLARSGNSLAHTPADISSKRRSSTAGLHLCHYMLWWQPENHHIWPFFQKTGGFLVNGRLTTSPILSSTASGCGRSDAE